MTRRCFILAVFLPAMRLGRADTPKNEVALAANAHIAAFNKWAEDMNHMQPNTMDAREAGDWESLPKLWRKVEHLHTQWYRGMKSIASWPE